MVQQVLITLVFLIQIMTQVVRTMLILMDIMRKNKKQYTTKKMVLDFIRCILYNVQKSSSAKAHAVLDEDGSCQSMVQTR